MSHSGFCNKSSKINQGFEFDKMQTDQGDNQP
jgi:hypothetical protein